MLIDIKNCATRPLPQIRFVPSINTICFLGLHCLNRGNELQSDGNNLCKSRERIAILKYELCKSSERINYPWERIPKGTDCPIRHTDLLGVFFFFKEKPHVPWRLSYTSWFKGHKRRAKAEDFSSPSPV